MSRAIAISRSTFFAAKSRQAEALSSVVVLGCAAALMFAGQPLPL
ncbi:MAG: hypothetical protein ABJ205_08455 [Erythrobacter sp.]